MTNWYIWWGVGWVDLHWSQLECYKIACIADRRIRCSALSRSYQTRPCWTRHHESGECFCPMKSAAAAVSGPCQVWVSFFLFLFLWCPGRFQVSVVRARSIRTAGLCIDLKTLFWQLLIRLVLSKKFQNKFQLD